MRSRRLVLDPLIDSNPVTLQILGICSALAVTTALDTALTMGAALIAVLMAASLVISGLRRIIPPEIRLIVQITVIATLVIVADLVLQAYLWDISQRLSIFVALIVTNCIVLGRAEAFALHNPPGPSLLDALGNGLGYAGVLAVIGALRELFGSGRLLGHQILPLAEEGGWFEPLGFMGLAPAAFFALGLLVWVLRVARPVREEAGESVSIRRRIG